MPPRTFLRFAALIALTCTAALAQNTIHVPADQPTIQAGINAAANGDTVLVAAGTYYENIDFKGKAINVTSSDGAAKTIIDGSLGQIPAVTFKTHETRNAILHNFTIQSGGIELYYGAMSGIVIGDASPTIANNIITHNHCYGIWSGGSPLIQNNEIDNTLDAGNCSFAGGAAIWLDGSSPSLPPTVVGNLIQNNTQSGREDAGGNGGAGIASWVNNAVIELNIIRNNSTHGKGGGIHLETAGALVLQNLVYGNQAGGGGGGFDVSAGNGPVTTFVANNTFVNNTYGSGGGSSDDEAVAQIFFGPFVDDGSSIAFVNNIVFGSSTEPAVACGSVSYQATNAPALILDHNIFYNSGGPTFYICPDPTGLFGNIKADPKLVNPAAFDFHLQAGSPAIDAGNTSVNALLSSNTLLTPTALTADLDSKARITDATGIGYPIIDMGAYEFVGVQDAQASTILLTPSVYTTSAGTPVTLTAKAFSGNGTPSGPITFTEDSTNIIGTTTLNAAGTATVTPALVPGFHHFVATYPGQGVFTAATSVQTVVVVSKYTVNLTLTSSLNPSLLGQAVTFTITAKSSDTSYIPSPIVLEDNNVVIATLTPDANGTATFSSSTLTVGYHSITAGYSGDSLHNSAYASITQQVTNGYATSTTITSSSNPSLSGQSVTFTATVTSANGVPTGTLQFTDNAVPIGSGTLDASGKFTLSTSTLTVGLHNITATYTPAGTFAGSLGTLYQTVSDITNTINVTSSLNPSQYGQPVTITAHVTSNSGSVAGGVRFVEGSNYLGQSTTDSSGIATITVSGLTVGGHLITAAFTANGSTKSFAGSYTQQVSGLPTATVLTASPITGLAHITPITLTATVTPATPGTPTPTGQVLFYLNNAQLNLATLVNGVATYTGPLPGGTDQIFALYLPASSDIYNGSTSNTATVTITAAPTALSLTSSANPTLAFQAAVFTATLSSNGQPVVGTVVFALDGQVVNTLTTNATGTAAISLGAAVGSHLITATYAGTSDYAPSSAQLTEIETPTPTVTVLFGAPNPAYQNQPVNFTVQMGMLTTNPSPYGTIVVYDGATPVANLTFARAQNNPTALFSLSTLAVGTHSLTAVFTPADGNFLTSTSAPFLLTILPQDFTITLSDPTLTLQTGHHHAITVSINSIGGLSAPFDLACGSALPAFVSCQWGQTSVTLPANGTVATGLTIDTDQLPGFLTSIKPVPGAQFMHGCEETMLATLLPLTLLGFKRRRNLKSLLPILLFAALASTLTACGANKHPYSTEPGTYAVPITAIEHVPNSTALITKTINLTLVVTP